MAKEIKKQVGALPEKFAAPFVKGQVIALDFGEEGEKFSSKYMDGEYSENRLWVVLSIAEFTNVNNANVAMAPLKSLYNKYKEYNIKTSGNDSVSIPTKGLHDQTAVIQSDRVVFQAYGELVSIMVTRIKSFPAKVLLEHFRHCYFIPTMVMEKVDIFINQFLGLTGKAEEVIKYGSINRMGYSVRYTHEESEESLTRTGGSAQEEEMEQKAKSEPVAAQLKLPPVPAPALSVRKLDDKKYTELIIKSIQAHPVKLNKMASPSLLQYSSKGESVSSLVNKFNKALQKGMNAAFFNEYGFDLLSITKNDADLALREMHVSVTKKGTRSLVKYPLAIDIYNNIINDERYLKQMIELHPTDSPEKIYSNLRYKEAVEEVATSKITGELTRDEVKQYLGDHLTRKKIGWTLVDASLFLSLYWTANREGWKEKFDTYFHFNTTQQNYYLTRKYGFNFEKDKSNQYNGKYLGYCLPEESIKNHFLNDIESYSIDIVAAKYNVKAEEVFKLAEILKK